MAANDLSVGEEYGLRWEVLPDNYKSAGLANSIVIPMSHKLYGFTVTNTNVSPQSILFFDLTALPADGTVPDSVFDVGGSTTSGVLWVPPRKVLRGVVLCNSSTPGSKTIGAADCFFDVQAL